MYNTILVNKGECASAPQTNPTKADYQGYSYTFLHWALEENGTAFNFETQIQNNTTLFAVYSSNSIQYTITYHDELNAENNNPTTFYVTTSTFTLEDLSFDGYTFKGWFDDDEYSNQITQIEQGTTQNIDLYAQWEENFVLIQTVEDLQAVNNNLSAKYKLANDINIKNAEWTPIGDFAGKFDGNNHKIYNFSITTQSSGYVGLFSKILNSAEVINLNVENASISGFGNQQSYVGILAGSNFGRIYNCNTSGSITSSYTITFGGLVGSNTGNISYSHSSANVTQTGSVSGDYSYVGGLIGRNYASINACYATGEVQARAGYSIYIGGLIGYDSGNISNCYATGNVTGTITTNAMIYVGGLVGYVYQGVISNCYAKGDVLAQSTYNDDINFSNAYSGGIIGYGNPDKTVEITKCAAYNSLVKISGLTKKYVGGIAAQGCLITDCYKSTDQTTTATGYDYIYIDSRGTSASLNVIWEYICSNWNNEIWDFSTPYIPTLK